MQFIKELPQKVEAFVLYLVPQLTSFWKFGSFKHFMFELDCNFFQMKN